MKTLFLLLSALPFTLSAQDLAPVETRLITRLQPEKATCVLKSPYFASILNHKTTVRFVMNVAWFVDSRDDLVVDSWGRYGCGCLIRFDEDIKPRVVRETSFQAHGKKHGVIYYGNSAYSWNTEVIQENHCRSIRTYYWVDGIRYINYNGSSDLRTALFMRTE